MSTVFDVQRRVGELFRLHGQATPAPQFNEGASEYRQRLLCVSQQLLPRNHVWSGVDIRRQPEGALDSIERALVSDRVAAFKAPTGPLRHVREECPRTGRKLDKFFGDPEETWAPFKGVTQRVVGFTTEGRGATSPQAKAAAAAAAHETRLAHAALATQRAAAGLR